MRKPRVQPEFLSCRPFLDGFETMIRAGVPTTAFSPAVLSEVTRARATQDLVSWDLFLDMLDSARAFWGDDAQYVAAFEQKFQGAQEEKRAFGGPGVSVQAYCRALFDSYGAGSFPGVSNTHRELDDGSMELTLWVPESSRDATSFWLGCKGVNRMRPCQLGLPAARIEADIEPQRAHFHLFFDARPGPRSARELERMQGIAEVLRVMRTNVERALERSRPPLTVQERVTSLAEEWSLTPRQQQVLGCICRGLSNREIGQELGCAIKTVELHVTELLRKARLDSRTQLLSRFAERG